MFIYILSLSPTQNLNVANLSVIWMVCLRYKDFVAKQLRNVMIHTQQRGIFPGLLCSIRIFCVVNVSGKQCRSFQRKNTFHHPLLLFLYVHCDIYRLNISKIAFGGVLFSGSPVVWGYQILSRVTWFQHDWATSTTGRYPWGVQCLVSTHHGGLSGPNSLVLAKFSLRGVGYSGHHIPQIFAWGHSRNFEQKIFTAQAGSCITDSLSHTTCVETKLGYQPNMYVEKQIRFGTMVDATHTNNFHWNNFHFALFKFKVVSLCSSLNLNLKKKLHLLTRFLL